MLHAGSVAKGTALRTVNDLDVAVYVKAGSAPKQDAQLQPWLADRLIEANPKMEESQFVPQDHCVKVSFRGSGLDVDVVPVLYEGAANDCGYLVRKHTGDRVLTSIPLHLKFIRSRKTTYGDDFKQLIRLVKWWKRMESQQDSEFRFKSFMIELLWAHLADGGLPLGDYPDALEEFFTFIVKGGLNKRIAFTDRRTEGAITTASSYRKNREMFVGGTPMIPSSCATPTIAIERTCGSNSRREYVAPPWESPFRISAIRSGLS
jgi:hypothetical protein